MRPPDTQSAKQLKTAFLAFVAFGLAWACSPQQRDKPPAKAAQPTGSVLSPVPVAGISDAPDPDSLVLDLVALKEKDLLGKPQTIRVADDPVFFKAKTYQAVPLRGLLEKFTAIAKLNPKATQIIFECEDGYNPSMPLAKVLAKNAYLAISDADAPQGTEWTKAVKAGHIMKVAPFYVVYTDVAANDHAYKWPYNLVRIRLAPVSEGLEALFPKDESLAKGYDLFRVNCLTCHAINGVGGTMGPELNYPKNITEYWQAGQLKAFIKNPASYRHNCKMPAVTHLPDRELDEIIRYVTYMKDFKTAPVAHAGR